MGCKNVTGLASRLVLGFEDISIDVGCAEPAESVRDEIDVSGDNVEGAMLLTTILQAGLEVIREVHGRRRRAVLKNFFYLSIALHVRALALSSSAHQRSDDAYWLLDHHPYQHRSMVRDAFRGKAST